MNCAELETHLTDFLEGELQAEVEAAALEHIATCPRCETVLRQTRQTIELASQYGGETPTLAQREGMLSSVLAELRHNPIR